MATGSLGQQAQSTFGLAQIAALGALGFLGATAAFATTAGRVCALIGAIAGLVAYFAKKS